ncbi:MAG: hypothetical protein R6U17_04795 [Thermoplasmata archaeon]
MVKIAYYVSDHGYGHATRSIAIIRRLISSLEDVEVHICCSGPLSFIKRSLKKENCTSFREVVNDFGYVTDSDLRISHSATKRRYNEWIYSWHEYIEKESRYLIENDVDLVISDIAPQPIISAHEASVPSMAISNFTWYEIYRELYQDLRGLDRLKKAYKKADVGLILPLETGMSPFKKKKKISLISREPKTEYAELRRVLKVRKNDILIFFGLGRSIKDEKDVKVKMPFKYSDVKFMTFSGYGVDFNDITIPEEETEGQDYLKAADLILSKFGYGAASEALRCKVPMMLTTRDIIEDKKAVAKLEKYGVARRIRKEAFIEGYMDIDLGDFIAECKNNYQSAPKRYTGDGRGEVVEEVLNLID